MNRRQFLATAASSTTALALASQLSAQTAPTTQATTAPTSQPSTKPSPLADLIWHDVRDWGLQGRGFDDTGSYFDRLPGRAHGIVREDVWNLSRHSAGMWSHFQTDATSIYIRYELLNELLAMPHMPATGVSGVDLYAQDATSWSYVATHLPKAKTIEARLVGDLVPGFRAYRLHLPLYNGVTSMQIGLPKDSTFAPVGPSTAKPILFYGTSITQGGCASRPGMAFTNILQRRLNVPMLNFGFSGNGRLEIEVARFLCEIDPAVFVIDCVANVSTALVKERTAPLVKLIRETHNTVPILLLDERTWSSSKFITNLGGPQEEKRAALRTEFEKLQQAGIEHLHYRDGRDLIGEDAESTVDGSHPNDLGMMRYADALEPTLRSLL